MTWDKTERAKYMARFKQEEVKIQAWESHEKRKPKFGLFDLTKKKKKKVVIQDPVMMLLNNWLTKSLAEDGDEIDCLDEEKENANEDIDDPIGED
ncbi:remorin 1.4 [Tanacetum coccineum]